MQTRVFYIPSENHILHLFPEQTSTDERRKGGTRMKVFLALLAILAAIILIGPRLLIFLISWVL